MMKGTILTALELKLFAAYSAVILAFTTSGIMWANLLYDVTISELL